MEKKERKYRKCRTALINGLGGFQQNNNAMLGLVIESNHLKREHKYIQHQKIFKFSF